MIVSDLICMIRVYKTSDVKVHVTMPDGAVETHDIETVSQNLMTKDIFIEINLQDEE